MKLFFLVLAVLALVAADCTETVAGTCECSGTSTVAAGECGTSITITGGVCTIASGAVQTSTFVLEAGRLVVESAASLAVSATATVHFGAEIQNEGSITCTTLNSAGSVGASLVITGRGSIEVAAGLITCAANNAVHIANDLTMTAGTLAATAATAVVNVTGSLTVSGAAAIEATNGGTIALHKGSCNIGLVSLDSVSTCMFGSEFSPSANCFPDEGSVELFGVVGEVPSISGSVKLRAGAQATVKSAITGLTSFECESSASLKIEAGASIETSGNAKFSGNCDIDIEGDAEVKVIAYSSYEGTFDSVTVNGEVAVTAEVSASAGRRLLEDAKGEYRDDGFYAKPGSGEDDSGAAALAAPILAIAAVVALAA